MNQDTRIERIEEGNLTPREAVILWMREAHTFDSLIDYGLWLIEQPDDVYPLVRIPAQVVETIRSRNKGTPDVCLQDDFYRAQRDVLFLFFIHKGLNMRATAELEQIRLRVSLLTESLRSIIARAHMVDTLRLERLTFPKDLSKPMPKRKKKPHEVDLERDITHWDTDEKQLRSDAGVLLEAEQLLAGRYLAQEQLLFDNARRQIRATLDMLAGLRETYRDVLRNRPPEQDDDFILWIAANANGKRPGIARQTETGHSPSPNVKSEARAFAEHIVVVARSEALSLLGEKDAGIKAVTDWVKASRKS